MQFRSILFTSLLLVATNRVYSSPIINDGFNFDARAVNMPESDCSVLAGALFDGNAQATNLCASYISTSFATATEFVTSVVQVTVTTGAISTFVVFSSGQPPVTPAPEAKPRTIDDNGHFQDRVINKLKHGTLAVPMEEADEYISSMCGCIEVTAATSCITSTSTTTITVDIETTTVYPCATPLPTKTSTIPYGLRNNGEYETSGNSIFTDSTTQGATLEGCCNACFFELQNCIQAFWYSYEGCVVMQPGVFNGTTLMTNDPSSYNGSGNGVSSTCPKGSIVGLSYAPDSGADERSTGDIAGPCGVAYGDL